MKTYKQVIQLVDYGWNKPEWNLVAFGSDYGYDRYQTGYPYHEDKAAFQRFLEINGWEKICDMPEGSEVWGKE